MRYKLVTLPKNTQKMPVLNVQPGSIKFTAGGGLSQPNVTVTPTTANVADAYYTFILHDQSVVTMNVGAGAGGAGLLSRTLFLHWPAVPTEAPTEARATGWCRPAPDSVLSSGSRWR